jgi:membrane-bound serine protease (ClpP class)
LLALVLWLCGLIGTLAPEVRAQSTAPIVLAEVRGVVNPALAGYISRTIDAAEASGAPLVVLLLDTPGGLSSSMRDITQRILASRIPVAVFVYPSGARAASAGVFITYAAHIAAMAPTTNIGSAHPVSLGPGGGEQETSSDMMDKITNDAVASIRSMAELRGRNADWAEEAIRSSQNLQASEALRQNVIDIVAEDVPDLLSQLDGRTVRLASGPVVLATRGVPTEGQAMNPFELFFHIIGDPTVAYLFLSIGGLALVYELGNPGAILPGVVGGIAVLLALYSLGTLPINFAGLGLIVFALILLVADFAVAGSGFLTVGGIVSFVLGSLLLAISPDGQSWVRVSVPAVIAMSLAVAGFFGFVVAAVTRVSLRSPSVGREAMIGEVGTAKTEVGVSGTVLVEGELWQATATDPAAAIPEGSRVRVVRVNGLHLTVEPA